VPSLLHLLESELSKELFGLTFIHLLKTRNAPSEIDEFIDMVFVCLCNSLLKILNTESSDDWFV
jgi:hypothetical protein